MRDAFGGTFLITILMVFVVLFVSFTAVIVNVAKTFRIKNEIINIIEQTQYDGTDTIAIDNYINNAGYQIVDGTKNGLKSSCEDNGVWGTRGYCISPVYSTGEATIDPTAHRADYYKVTVYVSISLPFFDIQLTLPVSGETKSYYDLA